MLESIPLNDHICFKLYVASRLVIKGYTDELAPLGLTYPKYLVLLALGEADGQKVGALVERLSLDFGTVSPLLKSLAAAGFVERRRSAADERSVSNHLTRAGRAVLKKAMGVAYDLYCRTEMARSDFVALRDQLDVYIACCEKVLENNKYPRKSAST